jgi:DNA-binding XRE family transcriptional regulator
MYSNLERETLPQRLQDLLDKFAERREDEYRKSWLLETCLIPVLLDRHRVRKDDQWVALMKLIHDYIEQAAAFERMAADEKDSKFKAGLLKQASAYHNLAVERARRLHVPVTTAPQSDWPRVYGTTLSELLNAAKRCPHTYSTIWTADRHQHAKERWHASQMDLRESFATNLRRLRTAKGLSQDNLAHEAELSRAYLNRLEHGRFYASLNIVGKLADVLEVEPVELLRLPRKRQRRT